MVKYEVYWRKFLLGRLTVDGEHYTYEVTDVASEVAKNVLLDPAVLTPHDGEPLKFFKTHIDTVGSANFQYHEEQYLLKEV